MAKSEIPNLKFSNGYAIPVIGLGTWKSKPGEVQVAVEVALDAGYRHIDCAFAYRNESEVGKAIENKIRNGVVKREDIFVTSKLWNTCHRPDLVMSACKNTLADLGLDYLDLYLIHWPFAFKEGNDIIPTDEFGNIILSDVDYMDTWKEMENCVNLGLVRSIGLSNFNSQQLQRVIDESCIKPMCLQVEINPYLNQSKLRAFCRERSIVITAYSPLGSPDSPFLKPGTPKLLEDAKLIEIGNRVGKSVSQVILRYLVQLGVATVPKSVTPTRIQENINIFDFELTHDDMAYIDTLNQNLRICHRDQ
ncbi:Alcohol dehydrogenase [NADP(+)] A [Blattella germanica]|nr:Alcohol dehydrogenase [NADP(+)] A [Blattella germanica]